MERAGAVIDHPADHPSPRSAWRSWSTWFVVLVAIGTVWSLSLPSYSGPDEQTHITKAAAVVRGQFLGEHHDTPIGSYTVVRVPEAFSGTPADGAKRCFSGTGAAPASCATAPRGGTEVVDAITYVGTYPPGYYLAVGWPSLIVVDVAAVPVMRLASVLVGSALLASALASATLTARRNRLLLGVVVATTPMAISLIAVVNPNGTEVAAAVSAAAAVLALAGADDSDRGRLVRRALVGFVACSLTRTPSIAFAGLALVLPWFAVRRALPWRAVPHRSAIVAVVGATAAIAMGWAVVASSGSLGEALTHESVRTSMGETGRFVRQAIGNFGELDTPLPLLVWAAWLLVALGLVAAGVRRGTNEARQGLVIAVIAAVAIPVMAQALAVPPVGARWQGRYGLPALVLVPLIAGASVPVRTAGRRWVAAALVAAGTLQVAALAVVARRYRVGVDGPVWFLGSGTWRPAAVTGGLLLAGALAWALLVAMAVATMSAPNEKRTTVDRS